MKTSSATPTPAASLVANQDAITCSYLDEPLLMFGIGGLHTDPKSGIARYGPRSYLPADRHPQSVKVGLLGTAETVEKAAEWLHKNEEGVSGNDKHPEFPGYKSDRGFFSSLEFSDNWNGLITQSELTDVLAVKKKRERFEQVLALLEWKLRLIAERDQPPDYLVVAEPAELVRRAGVSDYYDKEVGQVHRDLRRAFKALAMKYRIPTQLIRQPTLEGKDRTHPAKIAWNFFTALYCKAGGFPWTPYGLSSGTCYVGIGFFRPLGSRFPTVQTSLVQAFDESGDGLVLRGHDFEWNSAQEGDRSPHLSQELSAQLIAMVLDRYEEEIKQNPRRVVVHKTSRYWPAEREGIQSALKGRVRQYDLVALQRQSNVRLITSTKYPPLRGTRFGIGDLDYIYTTGFISSLNEFHGTHVPSPIQVADHVGQDTARSQLLHEILSLSKINWNSASFCGKLPVTLRFAELVGEIMKEIPSDREPLPQFKFYI